MNRFQGGGLGLLILFLTGFLLVGCSKDEDYPLPSTYSDPKSGRILDFGPEGLFAEKDGDFVTVGFWTRDGKLLTTTKLTYPTQGESKEVEVTNMENELRLNKVGSEFYTSLFREPASVNETSALEGLWKHESKEGLELYEFTPWGSCIWVRMAHHTDEVFIAGGNGRFRQPKAGRLELLGTEMDYPLNGFDKYSLVFDGDDFVTTNLANKELVRYIKVRPGELKDLADQILAADAGPRAK